jgi:hypothetical protein
MRSKRSYLHTFRSFSQIVMKKKKINQVEKNNTASLSYPHDDADLHKQYKDHEAIIDHLCEIPVTMQTYEFLGELFFHYTLRELGQHPPSDQWIAQLKAVRADVYQLYELARAANILKQLDKKD